MYCKPETAQHYLSRKYKANLTRNTPAWHFRNSVILSVGDNMEKQ